MSKVRPIYTFERDGRYFAVDVFDTFCFECDKITYDTLQYYPENTQSKIIHTLSEIYSEKELLEVWNELEYLRSIGSILKHRKIETWAHSITQIPYLNTLSFWVDKENLSGIQKNISLSLLKALSYVQANQNFQINIWLNQNEEVGQEDIDVFEEFLNKYLLVQNKNYYVNLYLSVPAYIRRPLKIGTNERLFLVFPNIHSELLEQIKRIKETEFQIQLNNQNGYILFFPERVPFNSVIDRLFNQGVKKIIFDPFAPLVLNPDIDRNSFFNELTTLTVAYTQQLKKGNQYILEPIMQLFRNIQHGIPIKRRDPAGAQEWFISPEGNVYGGYLYYINDICKIGNISSEGIPGEDAERLYRLGINTTPACITCWAQNFCGGGHGALHYRLTGKINEPSTDWCDAQRKWIEEVILRYQELNNAGIALSSDIPMNVEIKKPGRLTILKHILRSFFKEYISIRPLRPQDETWLADWETWNDNIYFTLNNSNILTTTYHEKEQEILSTTKDCEEWVIVDKKAKPRGLIKIQLHTIPNLSIVYIYFHDPNDYFNKDILENFQIIFNQIKNRFPRNRWLIPANPYDSQLLSFIQKLNFQKAGRFRDALFLHDKYHTIDIYIA